MARLLFNLHAHPRFPGVLPAAQDHSRRPQHEKLRDAMRAVNDEVRARGGVPFLAPEQDG